MSLRILIDMNLSPSWVEVLQKAGFEARHWYKLGAPNAPDNVLFSWARENKYIVFTHDLDFGAMLAATNAESPRSLSDLKEIGCKSAWPVHIPPFFWSIERLLTCKTVKICPRPAEFSLRFFKSDRLLAYFRYALKM